MATKPTATAIQIMVITHIGTLGPACIILVNGNLSIVSDMLLRKRVTALSGIDWDLIRYVDLSLSASILLLIGIKEISTSSKKNTSDTYPIYIPLKNMN